MEISQEELVTKPQVQSESQNQLFESPAKKSPPRPAENSDSEESENEPSPKKLEADSKVNDLKR